MGGLKRLLKRTLFAVAPRAATAVMSARARAHSHRLVREWGLVELNGKLIDRFGPAVQAGPFRGMTLTPACRAEHLGPFLLGTYEHELHPWLERVRGGRFAQVLDVGAKFGYYAVGLARWMPETPVVAFDTDWWARAATREMAAANRTPNVTAAGFCSPRWLDRHLLPGAFVFSDCEGYEGELFGRAASPALDSATLLIELHDALAPGVGDAVRRRFAATHRAEVVAGSDPPAAGADLSFLTPDEARAAVREHRGPQEWILLTPHGRP